MNIPKGLFASSVVWTLILLPAVPVAIIGAVKLLLAFFRFTDWLTA
jgi:hypothetical protein